MRLTRIEIEGFGALRAVDLHFGPAMNLVVGPNEAGKSTLQEAILAGLYGLQSADRTRPALVERTERWRPWQGGHFGLALEVHLEDGTAMRVERDLDAESVHVTDLRSGADLSGRFERDPLGGVQVGRELLGVSREIYTNTACISRSEVMRVEDAGSIKEAIAALADSAHTDRTAQRVLDHLREERILRVGRPRGRGGPLHDLEARLVELERQLAAARQARSAVDELARSGRLVDRGDPGAPAALAPRERRAVSRPRQLLAEHHAVEPVLGIGQAELNRVVEDARRCQCFFLLRFARARILYSRTRSCRSR